jgi:putative membrane protein
VTDAASRAPFDSGLQPERTLLSWQRTCLALVAGNAVAIKYLSDALGPWATFLGAAGIVLAGLAWVLSARRYRRARAGLTGSGRLHTDGTLPALVASAVVVACAAAVVILFALWRPW